MAELETSADVDAERALLAELLVQAGAVSQVNTWLTAADFTRPLHRDIYRAVVYLHAHEQEITGGALAERLRAYVDEYVEQRVADRALARMGTPAADDPMVLQAEATGSARARADGYRLMALGVANAVTASPGRGSALLWGQRVLDASLRRQIEAVGVRVQQIGRDGLGDPVELLDRAALQVESLQAAHDRAELCRDLVGGELAEVTEIHGRAAVAQDDGLEVTR